jgi:DNA polymerase-3 subunit delta'
MCPQCLKVLKEDHPDLMIVSSEKGRNGPIKIDQIRELKAFMSWRPALSDKKVCIIVDAEGMTDNASQSLLRVLEEPKEGTIILVASSKNLLETVVSRCQIVSFGVLPRETVELFLKQKFPQADRELLSIALDLCHGSITDAEKFVKPELVSLIRQLTSILSYTTKDWSVDLQMFFSSSDVFLAFYALKILLLRTINLKLGIKIPATGLAK